MTVAEGTRLTGASVLEQEAFDALIAHERDEADVIAAYETFAKDTDSDVVRFLIELIVEDERRHHQVIHQLANTIRAQATLEDINPRIPYLDVHRHRDKQLLAATRMFLDIERKDRSHLKGLAKTVEDSAGAVDAFIVNLMRMDTERHIAILKFIEHLIRRSPIR